MTLLSFAMTLYDDADFHVIFALMLLTLMPFVFSCGSHILFI